MGKKKTETKTTKKPSGLKVGRNGKWFNLTWKMPSEKYGKGVQLSTADHKKTVKKKKKNVKVNAWGKESNLGKNVTSKKVEINVKNYFPWKDKKISYIAFRVRGQAAVHETKKVKTTYTQSKWSSKSFKITKPSKPSLSFARNTAYTTTVNVNLPSSCTATGKQWVTRISCRYRLQVYKNGKWSYPGWNYETKNLLDGPGNLQFTINHGDESTNIENATSTKVTIQAALAGPAGWSNSYADVQKTFSYSAPYIPVIKKAVVASNTTTKKLDCSIKFEYDNAGGNPIQNIKVMYAFAPPNIDLTAQDPEWQEASISGGDNNTFVPDGSGKNTGYIPFTIPQLIPENHLLYVKIVAVNNGKETHSEEVLCKENSGEVPNSSMVLAKPSINGVSAPVGNKVTVDVTNQCLASGRTDGQPVYEEVDYPDPEYIRSYFERHYIKVDNPDPDDMDEYYEWDDDAQVFIPTEDDEPDPETTYYIFDGTYFQTGDTTINEEKTYYEKVGHAIDRVLIILEFLPNNLQSKYENMIIGFIETNPSDQSQDYSYTVEIPPDYTSSFKIGAYALIGQCELYSKIPANYDRLDPPVPGYKKYVVTNIVVRSERETFGGFIPLPPSNVQAKHLGEGNVMVTWTWDWTEADSAEVVWSDYSEALDSTEQPSSYIVTNQKKSKLIVRNLEMGKTWNFWVRLMKDENASIWSNPASESLMSSPNIPSLVLSKDVITMDDTVTASWAYVSGDNSPQGMAEVCLCSIDGSGNEIPGNIIAKIPQNEDDDPERQYVVIDPKTQDPPWISGETYNLAVRVVSQNGLGSVSWSKAQAVTIVDPLYSDIYSTSLELIDSSTQTTLPYPNIYDPTSTYLAGDHVLRIEPDIDDNEQNPFNRNIARLYIAKQNIDTPEEWVLEHWNYDENIPSLKLTKMPLDVVAYKGPENTVSTLRIERAEDYFIDRPDNDGTYGGYEGEIVYENSDGDNCYLEVESPSGNPSEQNYYEYDAETKSYIPTTDNEVVSGKTYYYAANNLVSYRVELNDLFGYIDDDASYYLTYIVEDSHGQHAEMRYEFDVKWDHQAVDPDAEAWIENVAIDEEIKSIAKIQINNPDPESVMEGDYCDIYRISADGYDLIYEKAQFGQTYVDPYPTIGEHGGHRIVYKTLYGDYITAEGSLAMLDILSYETDDIFESDGNIIDFGDENVKLMFNMDLSNTWSKDFQQTKYLGGSIQGDWNVGVTMSSSLSVNVLISDWDSVSKIRSLAQFADICHVRTKDGMNYLADVQVSERIPYEAYFTPENEVTNIGEYSFNITKVDSVELDGMTLQEWEESISEYEIPVDPDEGV